MGSLALTIGSAQLQSGNPMKVRDSGMPDEQMWQGFFDPPAILSKLGFADAEGDVVDFGCMAPWAPPVPPLAE